MIAGKWVAPALLFFAGAVFGRILGVKPLLRGAMTAATMSGMLPDAGSGSARPARSAPRKIARSSRRRPAQKRSRAA